MKLTLEKQWETFHDRSYYDMFAVRLKSDRGFNSQTLFHVPSKAEADALCDILNGLQGQIDAERAELAHNEAENKRLREALLFYANGRHMSEHGVDEPPEWVSWDCENGGAIETGAVAEKALAQTEQKS